MMEKLNVVIVGDSVVWGQGLRTEDKFAFLAASQIAQLLGKEADIKIFSARSGAKINAARNERGVERITLPSGHLMSVSPGDRFRFYDTFPTLFPTDDEQIIAFFDGRDEEVGFQLFGEINVPFPTVTYQVERVDDQLGKMIDLIIMDGSVNDVGFGGVLNPEGPSIREIDEAIKQAAYVQVKDLLTKVRNKFPKAVIIFTGYFAPFSQGSNRIEIKNMMKYMSGESNLMLALNDFLFSPWGYWLSLGIGNWLLRKAKDLNVLAGQAIFRSEFAQSRALYWLRRAISELYETDKRGPGIIFVHPGFKPENSLFAGTPFVREGYKRPEPGSRDRYVVEDAALEERLSHIPRFHLLNDMKQWQERLKLLHSYLDPSQTVIHPPEGRNASRSIDPLVALIKESLPTMLHELDGPISLRNKLLEVIEDPISISALSAAITALGIDIGRMEETWIASFIHPNQAGARRYRDRIVERYTRHQQLSLKDDLFRLASTLLPSSPVGSMVVSAQQNLTRYGLDPETGLKACLQHMIVDSIAVDISIKPLFSHPRQEKKLLLIVNIGLGWVLESPLGGLSIIDTFGELHLASIKVLSLLGTFDAELTDFKFLVNGKVVFRSPTKYFLTRSNQRMVIFDFPNA